MRMRTRRRSRTSGSSGSLTSGLTLLGQDSFTDANGTDLDVHVPELGTWVDSGANIFEVQSNTCAPAGTAGTSLMEGPTSRGVIDVTFPTLPAATNEMVVIHYIDTNNKIQLANFASLIWILAEITGGAVIQSVNTPIAANDSIRIVLDGTTVGFYRNGTNVGALTGIAAGKVTEASHGFQNLSTGTTMRADNWAMYG